VKQSDNTRRALADVPSAKGRGGPPRQFPRRLSGPITASDEAIHREFFRDRPEIEADQEDVRVVPGGGS